MVPPSAQVFEIFQGDAKTLPLQSIYDRTFQPLDLTNCLQIVVRLPLAVGGFAELTLLAQQVAIVSPNVLGQIAVPIPSALSETLNPGTFQDVFAQYLITEGDEINVTAGLAVEQVYVITALGTTTAPQWQALGLPEAVTPAVGVTFTCNSAVAGMGTGTVEAVLQNSPFTVAYRKCFSVFE